MKHLLVNFVLFALFIPSMIGCIFVYRFVRDEFKGIPYMSHTQSDINKVKVVFDTFVQLRSHFQACILDRKPEYYRLSIYAYLYVLTELKKVVSELNLKSRNNTPILVEMAYPHLDGLQKEILKLLDTSNVSRTIFYEYNEKHKGTNVPLFEKLVDNKLPVEEVYNQLFSTRSSPTLKMHFEKYLMDEDKAFELYLLVNPESINAYNTAELKSSTPVLFGEDITFTGIHEQLKTKPGLKKKFDAFVSSTKQPELFTEPIGINKIEESPDYIKYIQSVDPFRKTINTINIKWLQKKRISEVLHSVYCAIAGNIYSWENQIRYYITSENLNPVDRDMLRCEQDRVSSYRNLIITAITTQIIHLGLAGYYMYTYRSNYNILPYVLLYGAVGLVLVIALALFIYFENFSDLHSVYVGASSDATECMYLKGKHWDSMFIVILFGLVLQFILQSVLSTSAK